MTLWIDKYRQQVKQSNDETLKTPNFAVLSLLLLAEAAALEAMDVESRARQMLNQAVELMDDVGEDDRDGYGLKARETLLMRIRKAEGLFFFIEKDYERASEALEKGKTSFKCKGASSTNERKRTTLTKEKYSIACCAYCFPPLNPRPPFPPFRSL